MKKKISKEKGKTYWRNKGSEEAKRQRRNETDHCEICYKSNCKLEGHHLLTVGAYPQMANQKVNIIVICVHCHKFGKISFHGSGTDLMKEKFDNLYPGKMDYLREIAATRKRVDYEKEYQELVS